MSMKMCSLWGDPRPYVTTLCKTELIIMFRHIHIHSVLPESTLA